MKISRQGLKRQVKKALADHYLSNELKIHLQELNSQRSALFPEASWEKCRQQVFQAKRRAIERLPKLVQQFKQEAELTGAKVHFAETSQEANALIAGLATERQVQRIAKSRSFTAKEVNLSQHLRKNGFDVCETDISQWILHATGQFSSHFAFPMIHLSKARTAELLAQTFGKKLDSDPANLVSLVRATIRRKMLSAQMAVTGANAAVAENGSVMIVDNEGNCRLLATLPSIHVVLIGAEKIVETTEDAISVLRLLPPHSTGERIPSYVTWVHGPVPYTETGGIQRELHIILLNNGRLELREDPWYQDVFQCIRCGSCANVCPAYRNLGGAVFGETYPGPVGLVLSALLKGIGSVQHTLNLCNQCLACAEVCPAKVPIPDLILQLRQDRAEGHPMSLAKKIAIRKILPNKKIFHAALRGCAILQKPLINKDGFIEKIPLFQVQTASRSLSPIAKRRFRDVWAGLSSTPLSSPAATVTLFPGCAVDFLFPEIAEAAVRTLRAYNVEVLFSPDQTCCGAPARNEGEMQTLLRMAQANLKALSCQRSDFIITLCPLCNTVLKETYPALKTDDETWNEMTDSIAKRVTYYSAFLVDTLNLLPETLVRPQAGLKEKVTYHDPCDLSRGLHVRQQPRTLIQQIEGAELVEMKDSDACCGWCMAFSLSFPGLSGHILNEKIHNIKDTDAEIVVTDCPGCILQIRGGLGRRQLPVDTMHTAEYLAWKMGLLE